MGLSIKFKSNIRNAQLAIDTNAKARMAQAVNEVRNETLNTLTGTRSGRQYKVPGTTRTYTASAPGEPPAQRLGELRQSITGRVTGALGQIIGKVGTDKDYGPPLEYGTKKMAARPWLRISFEKSIGKIQSILGVRWF